MGKGIFQLVPFDNDPFSNRYQIDGAIQRSGSRLCVAFRVTGPLDELCIEPKSDLPRRKDHLWQKTCFECFISTPDTAQYWEINLSPAGHWNVYRFDDYRRGMQEERTFSRLEVSTESTGDKFELNSRLDLTPIGLTRQPIVMALSAVLKGINGELTYWALTHAGPHPDFHRREGFVISLEAQEQTSVS